MSISNVINGFVVGDDLEIRRNITVSQAITKAWLYIECGATDVTKEITTTNVAGTGQIENDGATTGIAIIRFDLSKANTETIATTTRSYDIQIKLLDTKINTPEVGVIQLVAQLTTAQS